MGARRGGETNQQNVIDTMHIKALLSFDRKKYSEKF